jgi:hypothetical protein
MQRCIDIFGLKQPPPHVISSTGHLPIPLDKKTPIEVWSGSPADYSELRVFGCTAYAHIDNGKLEPRAVKCIFLGYGSGVKAYKL